MFHNTVFTKIEDLFAALGRAGIIIATDNETLSRAYVQPKSIELDAEFAR